MKKKILAAVLAAAMLTMTGAAFADTEITTNEDITAATLETAAQKQYISATFTLNELSTDTTEGVLGRWEASNENGEAVIVVVNTALVVNNQGERISAADIKAGDSVTIYYNINDPMLMIMPPQYIPEVLVVNNENPGFVDVDRYSEELVNADNTLALNIDDSVSIEYASGKRMSATAEDIKNADAAVFYENTTRSIPAQTTPSKVIILDNTENNDTADADINQPADINGEILDDIAVEPETHAVLTVNGSEVDAHFVELEGVTMLPVRTVAESLGLDVAWDDVLKSVTVGTTAMGVTFRIDEDYYTKARMTPAQLGMAPQLITIDDTGITYVPLNFFSDILEAQVDVDEVTGSVAINR